MGTRDQSRIKIARRPARGDDYPCGSCGFAIISGDEYFSLQTGQRSSVAFCLRCVRGLNQPTSSVEDLRLARELYGKRYGIVA